MGLAGLNAEPPAQCVTADAQHVKVATQPQLVIAPYTHCSAGTKRAGWSAEIVVRFDGLGPRMMRLIPPCFVLGMSLLLSGCAVSSWSQQPGRQLTTAFWYWQGSSVDPTWSGQPVDAVFVQVGNIRSDRLGYGPERWFAYG